MPDQPRSFTIDVDRRGRLVQIALALLAIPFVVSLAGLALRSPLTELTWLVEGPLGAGAAASGGALLLLVGAAWTVDWWTVRKQLRALAAVNRDVEAAEREIEAERARHAPELSIETMEIDARAQPVSGGDLEIRPADLAAAGRESAADPLAAPGTAKAPDEA